MKQISILFITVFFYFSLVSSGWAGTMPPDRPSGLKAVPANSFPMINWLDYNSDDEYGFIIERDGAQIAAVVANVTTYYDRALTDTREYYYTVRSFNGMGNSRISNEVSAAGVSIPDPPSCLDATAVSSSSIELTWADNSDDESGFKIERNKSGGAYSQINTVGRNITAFIDTGLTANTKYFYRVRAYNSLGNSLILVMFLFQLPREQR